MTTDTDTVAVELVKKRKRRKTSKWTVLFVVAVLVFFIAALVKNAGTPGGTPVAAPSGGATKAPLMTVTTHTLAYSMIRHELPVTGTVFAHEELSIGSEAQGLRIDEVLVDEGQHVVKGQVLAVLDASVLEAQLEQLQARLQGAQASEAKARQPNRKQDVDGLQSALGEAEANAQMQRANLEQAQATWRNDEANAARYHRLIRIGGVSMADAQNVFTTADKDRAQVQAAEQQVAAAESLVSQAESRLDLAHVGGSQEDAEVAAAAVAEIRGEIRGVQAQIAQTRILAPDRGLILKREAHIGDVTGGKTLFTMARGDRYEMRAQVPSADLREVQKGDLARVTGHGATEDGQVWKVSPSIDPSTRLGEVRITLPEDSSLVPGMFAEATIAEGERRALTVPLTAVQGTTGAYFVFVYDRGLVRRRPVTVGAVHGDDETVTSGLEAGNVVVVDGAPFLSDGDLVSLPSSSPAPASNSGT